MAYIANQPKQGQTVQDKNKELMLNTGVSGATGMSQLGGPVQSTAQSQPKFQNIQGMLSANKGAGAELTGRISSGIGGEIGQQKKKVGKAGTDVEATAGAIQAGKDTTSEALASLNKDLSEDIQVKPTGIAEGTKNTFGGKDYTYTGGAWKDATGNTLSTQPTLKPGRLVETPDQKALRELWASRPPSISVGFGRYTEDPALGEWQKQYDALSKKIRNNEYTKTISGFGGLSDTDKDSFSDEYTRLIHSPRPTMLLRDEYGRTYSPRGYSDEQMSALYSKYGLTYTPPTTRSGLPPPNSMDYSKLISDAGKNDLTNLAGYTTGTTQQKQGEDLTKNLTKFQDIAGSAQAQAAQRMGQLGTAEGRTSLLQEMIARGQRPYSGGASALDQAFMQRQGGTVFKQQQQKLREQQKALGEQVKAGQLSGDIAKQDLSESKQLSKDVQKALGVTEDEFIKAQEKERDEEVAQANIINSALEKMLVGNAATLSQDESSKLRDMLRMQNLQLGQGIYGMTKEDLLPYINKADVDIKTGSMIDADELKKYQTLQRLMGRDESSDIYKNLDNEYNKASISQDLISEINRRKDLYSGELGHTAASDLYNTLNPDGFSYNPFAKSGYTYADLDEIRKIAVNTLPSDWLNSERPWSNPVFQQKLVDAGYLLPTPDSTTWRGAEALYNRLSLLDDMRKRHGYDVTLGGIPLIGKGYTPKV